METHHAYYFDAGGAIAGREIPGIDVFPVCAECHKPILHDPTKWFGVADPLSRRNMPRVIKTLRANWAASQLLGSGELQALVERLSETPERTTKPVLDRSPDRELGGRTGQDRSLKSLRDMYSRIQEV